MNSDFLTVARYAVNPSDIDSYERFTVYTSSPSTTVRSQLIGMTWYNPVTYSKKYVTAVLSSSWEPLVVRATTEGPWERFWINWL